MTALPFDYDADPGRWASHDFGAQLRGDVHPVVARMIAEAAASPTIDAGGGDGRLLAALPDDWPSVLVDLSPTQLAHAPARAPRVLADCRRMPFANGTAGSVAMLWMLYHLDDPIEAIAEAARLLRPGGLFFASTSSRSNDPELTDGYPPTPFDAEEAVAIVSEVFADVSVERWDAPSTLLQTAADLARYCRSHCLPAEAAGRVEVPVRLTKRGCLLVARR